MLVAMSHINKKGKDVNCIRKHDIYMQGQLQSIFTKRISMKKAKELGKKLGLSFNELCMGLISKTWKHYFQHYGDNSDEVSVTLSYTFQSIPMDPLKYEFCNNVAGMTFYMKLCDDFTEACQVNLKHSNMIKKSLIPWGTYVYLWFMVTMQPTAYFLYNTKNAAAARAKFSFLLSNVPGLLKRTTFFGGNVCTRI